jgi:hypothetical protein
MDRVPAEIPKKVRMLLQNNRANARSGEEKPGDHSRRTSPDNAKIGLDCRIGLLAECHGTEIAPHEEAGQSLIYSSSLITA